MEAHALLDLVVVVVWEHKDHKKSALGSRYFDEVSSMPLEVVLPAGRVPLKLNWQIEEMAAFRLVYQYEPLAGVGRSVQDALGHVDIQLCGLVGGFVMLFVEALQVEVQSKMLSA